MTADAYTPSRNDKFSFGIWTVGLGRGLAYEHLDQLALEHLYGIR